MIIVKIGIMAGFTPGIDDKENIINVANTKNAALLLFLFQEYIIGEINNNA